MTNTPDFDGLGYEVGFASTLEISRSVRPYYDPAARQGRHLAKLRCVDVNSAVTTLELPTSTASGPRAADRIDDEGGRDYIGRQRKGAPK